jgi:hypothetical protein
MGQRKSIFVLGALIAPVAALLACGSAAENELFSEGAEMISAFGDGGGWDARPPTDAGPTKPRVDAGPISHADAGPIWPPIIDAGTPTYKLDAGPWKIDGGTWLAHSFTYDRAFSECAGGARYVQFSPRYSKWVGVELCSPKKYKIFLGEALDGVFHEIGDFAGHGQDHCELVNPAFTIPNEDDVTSGGCTSCSVTMAGWISPGPVPVYARARAGEGFELITWPQYNLYTSSSYECGVAVP